MAQANSGTRGETVCGGFGELQPAQAPQGGKRPSVGLLRLIWIPAASFQNTASPQNKSRAILDSRRRILSHREFMPRGWWICVLGCLFAQANGYAGGESVMQTEASPQNRFTKGMTEIEVLAGAFFSVDAGQPSKPTINLASENFRFGIMLATPGESGLLAGNAELLFEGFAAEVFEGPGTVVGGVGVILRYNFVRPHAVIVPYCQIGGGGALNDISRTESQSLVGADFEFTLQGSLGLRVLLNERCSLQVESGLLHLSNGGMTDRNHGLNAPGGLAGISFSF